MSRLLRHRPHSQPVPGEPPRIIAERCVHTHLAEASCLACVDSCPCDAWVLDGDQLGIDTDRCDGCGLCTAACPQGAVHTEISLVLKEGEQGPFAMAACEHGGANAATGIIGCLHAIDLRRLLTLYRLGVNSLVSLSGDCDSCTRGDAPRLEVLIANVNLLLEQRKLPAIQHRSVNQSEWSQMHSRLPALSADSPSSRRRFLQRMIRSAIEIQTGHDPAEPEDNGGFEPPGSILPSQAEQQMVPCLPRIDPKRCNACNACVKLCPHRALRFVRDAVAYRIHPDECTSCGICVDVCDQRALIIETWAVPDTIEIPLRASRCSDCGSPYLMSMENPGSAGLCRICSRHRHLQNLYQVLD